MPKPFKFRYVNEIVGSFVLLVILAMVAAVILAGKAQDWFEPVYTLELDFPPEGSLGLQKSAEVQILGYTVGKVERIKVDAEGAMTGEIVIKGDFFQFVREDSQVLVRKKFGIAGDAYLDITKGRGAPVADGARLKVVKDTEITEMAQDLLQQFRDATLPVIEQIRLTVEEYGKLAADLRNPEAPLLAMLANVEKITAGLQKGEGSAGMILRDPALANELQAILRSVNDALAQVQRILDDVKRTTGPMPAVAQKVGHEANDLPGLVLQTQETLRESERLIQGIQRHWLLRGSMPATPPTGLIPATDIGGLSPVRAGEEGP